LVKPKICTIYLDPEFLKSAAYDYVVFQMDDVRLYGKDAKFDLPVYFRFIQKYNLAAASPVIINTPWPFLQPNVGESNHEGRIVNFIEIQSTTFRIDAWKCYWDLNDTEFPSGWTDDFMQSYCSVYCTMLHFTRKPTSIVLKLL